MHSCGFMLPLQSGALRAEDGSRSGCFGHLTTFVAVLRRGPLKSLDIAPSSFESELRCGYISSSFWLRSPLISFL